MITIVIVWWHIVLLKKWTKVGPRIFFFDFEFLILILFQRPTSSKNGRSFHGEVVTFISVIDGIRDIFEA
jgi:hypothetical protein